MNLADMLSYADIHDLSRIAVTYNCECNGHSKNELIQSILSTVTRRDVFERQVVELSIEDVRFLNSLIFDKRGSFSIEELIARVQQSRFVKEENLFPGYPLFVPGTGGFKTKVRRCLGQTASAASGIDR
ncbi:MAG: hypothetical protein K0S39_5270 [Paenibacillus sp.]|nr:hypothetical protein [Paenibacillus sp.]